MIQGEVDKILIHCTHTLCGAEIQTLKLKYKVEAVAIEQQIHVGNITGAGPFEKTKNLWATRSITETVWYTKSIHDVKITML